MTDALDKARHPIHPDYGPCDALGPADSCAACVEAFDAAKQRIAELEGLLEAFKNLEPNVKLMIKLARKAGFEAAKKAAVGKVPTNWLDPAVAHMLGGKTITNADVERAMQNVAQAISELKPEGE